LDGTRKTPPGREARNLSRRDGIRAGSVSGPWRSMPKSVDEPREPSETARPQISKPGSPLDWTGRTSQPHPEADPEAGPAADRDEPDHVAEPTPRHEAAHRDAVPLRGTRGLAGWIVFGIGVAVALIAAAVYLRPDATPPSAGPAQIEAPAAEVAAAPPPAATTEAPAPVADDAGIVRLRVGPEADPSEIARLSEALEAEGLGAVRIEALPFSITQSRVGYYRPEDLQAAEALARLVEPLIGRGDVAIRDYGDLLDDTEPGRLDLWLGD
jgi:hypothetical protein